MQLNATEQTQQSQEVQPINQTTVNELDNVEKALGIKKGEPFKVIGFPDKQYIYNGIEILEDKEMIALSSLIFLINTPELIEKLPQKIVVPGKVWQTLEGIRKIGGRYILKSDDEWGNKCIDIYTDSGDKTFKHGKYIGEIFIKELINFMQDDEEIDIADILDSGRFIEGD
jgi:hypothetical protein